MQHDEGKQQGQRNGERHDDGRTKIDQEENQDNQHQDHAAEQVVFHGIGGQLHQVAAIVKGVNLNVGREDLLVEFLGLSFDALENVLRLLSTQHENDAFHRIVVVLETEFAQPWRMADHDAICTPLGISKNRATPTWCLYSAAIGTVLFMALYWIADAEGMKRWAAFMKPAGSNQRG